MHNKASWNFTTSYFPSYSTFSSLLFMTHATQNVIWRSFPLTKTEKSFTILCPTSTRPPSPFFFLNIMWWVKITINEKWAWNQERKSVDDLRFLHFPSRLRDPFSSFSFFFSSFITKMKGKLLGAFNRWFFLRHSRMCWWKTICFTEKNSFLFLLDCHGLSSSGRRGKAFVCKSLKQSPNKGHVMTLICCLLSDHWLDILLVRQSVFSHSM